ncbi:ArnT family glycosyltransferase [Vulgatibacter incomptus]|uniref:Polymyxin resistance protein ArnT, undecaprenyl phosphate-alpha-L-Ara4N transferase n=1 Tax=Vulgatibacter incomptus TaxID=1391653 RepID=A0A0K1PEQ4_9BACT|nr:glycosyltransferase family 39 protein [Vulgatibacter incomptus]AKU91982.1 Polymyxin resistance protein ArnT, undecaprenyl phosphate-alpha-L-Ara4N transferase [Vulgatibacter incomptus]
MIANEKRRERRTLFLIVGLSLLVALAAIGTRGLYETTEGRFAEVAREMLETGNVIEPQLAYQPHFDKPPLSYWAMAGGMALLGVNEAGARAGNGLAFALAALVVVGIGTRLWDRRTGLVAGLVYATSALPAIGGGSLASDGFVTLFELLTMLAYVSAVRSEDRKRERRYVVLTWLALGLAFLAKGTAGLLPLAPILGYDLVSRRPFRMVSPVGIAAFLLVGLGWYALVFARNDGAFDFMIDQQITGRLFRDHYNRNPQWYKPFTMYLPLVLFGCGPWIWFGARAAWVRRHALRARSLLQASPAALLALWIVPPLVVFSLARSRLPLYVLPLCAPMALLLARALVSLSREGALRRAATVAVPTAALLSAGLLASSWIEHPNDMRALAGFVRAEAPSARVYAFDEEYLHGLRFYLRGALTRLAETDEPWTDQPIDAALSEIATAREPAAIVVSPRHADALRTRLEARGLHARESVRPGWTLFVTEPGTIAAQ